MFYDNFIRGSSFIQRRYQLRFITYFCGSILAVGLLSILILYLYTYSEIGGTSYYQALLTVKGLKQHITHAMMFTGGIVIILASAATLTITLIGSHKIAGPIYRLERSLEAIGNGNLSQKIKFRENDAIRELADNINKTTESLNEKVSIIGMNLKGVREEAERLRANPQHSQSILLEKIRLLKKNVSGLKTN
ncbi:MAG: hypothetical protein AAB275_07610 [Deltaproteobacteria bacterium]